MRGREGFSGSFDGSKNHERRWLHASGAAVRLFAAVALLAGAAHGGMILDWSGSPPAIGGSGTWNTTGDNWTPDGSTFEPWSNSGIDTAQFFGAGGTVTLGTAITAAGLNFGASGYTLAGGNTLTVNTGGQITIASGTSPNIDAAVGVGDSALLQGSGTLNINGASGGSLALSGNGLSSLDSPVLNLASDPTGGAALTINGASGSGAFGGTITGAGSLMKSGTSVVTLSGTNTFTGATTISGGSLVLGNPLALENSTVNINVDNGLNLNGLASAEIGALAGTGALNLGATALYLGQFGNNADTAYSGVINATAGGLLKYGTGTLTLSGGGTMDGLTVASGGVNITGGTLTLTDANAPIDVTGGALTISGGATVNAASSNVTITSANGSATINISGAGTTLNAGPYLETNSGGSFVVSSGAVVNTTFSIVGNFGSGTLNISSGGTVNDAEGIIGEGILGANSGTATVAGQGSLWANQSLQIGGFNQPETTGTLNINSGGSVTVTGVTMVNASDGAININSGTLTTGQLIGTTGTINLQANPAGGSALVLTGGTGTAEFDGTITGAGGISQTGGNQVLTAVNTYTGQTLVSGGTLTQQGGSNISQITASNGGVFYALNTTLSPLNGFGAITAQSGGQVEYDGTTVNGGFLSGSGHVIVNGPGAALNVTTFNGTGIRVDGVVTQNALATFNDVTNNGTINNNATLTWNGGSIGSGGVLNVNNVVNSTSLVSNGVINIFNGNSLDNTGSDLVLGGGSRTYVGSLADPGGTLSETGGTIELNGGLLVNNGTVDGTLDVNFGGLAEGAGTYGAVNIGTGGVFHPGNSPGTVTSSSATLGAGGGFDFDIDNATGAEGTDWSLWDITGDLDIVAGMTPNSEFTIFVDSLTSGDASGPLENFNPADSYSWTIIDAANINGFSASEFALNTTGFDEPLDGGTFSLVSNGQDLTLDFTAAASTPEPGTMFLLGIGLVALGLARRKFKTARTVD